MQPIPKDYVAPSYDDQLDDGLYAPESIDFMETSIDKATGKPCLVDSKFGLKVMFNMTIVGNDDDTIPLSCRLNEIPFMVQAFTHDTAKLLPAVPALDQVQAIENYLMLAIQLCNEGIQRPNVTVKGGWGSVYRLIGNQLPEGNYHGYLTDITSKNSVGLPAPLPSDKYPDQLQYDSLFLIVADQYGEQCGWSGVSHFQRYMKYKATAYRDETGQLTADWIRVKKANKAGEFPYTGTAQEFSLFVGTTAPSLFPPPPAPPPNFNDPMNILPEWIIAAQRDRVLLSFAIGKNKAGFSVVSIKGVLVADPNRLKFDVKGSIDIPSVGQTQPTTTRPLRGGSDNYSNRTREDTGGEFVIKAEEAVNHISLFHDLLNILVEENDDEFNLPLPVKKQDYGQGQLDLVKKYIAPHKFLLSTTNLNDFDLNDVRLVLDNLPFQDLSQDQLTKIAAINDTLEVDTEVPF